MATLYYYKFNNYYNRKLKRFSSLSEYQSFMVFAETGNNLNFNPNDGVNTQITAGRQENPYNVVADYCIYSEDNQSITSRWFIIEASRNRGNQYKISLRRDLLADFYDSWTQSDCFVEKAILPDNSPFIYNQEQITTNQIKTDEVELKDNTKMAWICGFINRESPETQVPIKSAVKADITKLTYDDYQKYTSQGAYSLGSVYVDMYVRLNTGVGGTDFYQKWTINTDSAVEATGAELIKWSVPQTVYRWDPSTDARAMVNYLKTNRSEFTGKARENCTLYGVPATSPDITKMYSDLGKIFEKDGKYYKMTRIEVIDTTQEIKIDTDKAGDLLYTHWNNIMNAFQYKDAGNNPVYVMRVNSSYRKPIFQQIVEGDYTLTMPAKDNRLINRDGPFDMFCIPYSDDYKVQVNGETAIQCNKEFAMSIAQSIGVKMGSGNNVYDIQLLPYCPFAGITSMVDNTLTLTGEDAIRYTKVLKDQTTVYYLFWTTSTSGTLNIPYVYNVINKKMSNQVDMMRLVSPSYSGQFEFNPARNDGVSYFNVDYTYLPQSSYIHVNPDFKGLYGKDYNDARGLIVQGNQSIMYLSSAWEAYQTQNKNYLEIFNREVQNLETNYKYQRINSVLSTITGAIGAGVGIGALVGSKGGVGAGIAAGAASLGGGIADLAIQQQLHNEQLDYKNDMFGYQLDNIKALPNSIAKTTAYTENNKIFPILEYYTCTEEEKKAVASKIAFNGMTVGIIDKPINYLNNTWSYDTIQDKGYFKAKLIHFDDIDADDFHIVNSLGDELNQGVYTK